MKYTNHSIQIVIVLYKIKLEDSLSYKTLCNYISVLSFNYELLIYNNSPEFYIEEKENYFVMNAEYNKMLAGAYNFALQRAIKNNRNWLLLLDQDTYLSEEYFKQLNLSLNNNENVAAIIPKLQSSQIHLSPKSCCSLIGHWGKMSNLQTKGIIKNKTIQAFNSAALISVQSLQKIGGFSLDFPLYELDYWVFYHLSKNKEQFYLMDVVLSHDLTMLDYRNKMTSQRYDSIISAEFKFSKQLGILAFLAFKVRLFFRLLKQFMLREKRPYTHLTLKYLCKAN
jgi:hypothetical protein